MGDQKKSSKAGRRGDWCKSYRSRGQREINKRRRLTTYCLHNPHDEQARAALKKLGGPCSDKDRGVRPEHERRAAA